MNETPQNLLIVGAGGHGKVVAETAAASGQWQRIAFLDNQVPPQHHVVGFPVLGNDGHAASLLADYPNLVVAIGDQARRLTLSVQFEAQGFVLANVIHPTAVVSPSSQIGPGTVVFANVVVNASAQIGKACILNTASVIEHDNRLGDGVHISPNATLAGTVSVGTRSWIGASATVLPGVQIGAQCIVGAGAVVCHSVPDNQTVVGVPAHSIGVSV